ncbi:MAG: hypothetical protein IMZ55_10935, partial [Acidobacteria bacterium]|nr:hypothetical protein [Acidobacteriota bacterium]
SQLFACYARVKQVRGLADVIGEDELSLLDKQFMEFGAAFEKRFLSQGEHEDRRIAETLDLGWDVLSMIPRDELHRLNDALLDAHYHEKAAAPDAPADGADKAAPGGA